MRSRTSSSSSNALLLAHVPGAEQKRRRRSLYFFGMISPQRDGWRKCAQSLSCEGSLVTHLWGKEERERCFPTKRARVYVDFSKMVMNTEQMTDFYLHNIERTRRVRRRRRCLLLPFYIHQLLKTNRERETSSSSGLLLHRERYNTCLLYVIKTNRETSSASSRLPLALFASSPSTRLSTCCSRPRSSRRPARTRRGILCPASSPLLSSLRRSSPRLPLRWTWRRFSIATSSSREWWRQRRREEMLWSSFGRW